MMSSRRSSVCCDPYIGSILLAALRGPSRAFQDIAETASQDTASTLTRRSSCTLEGRQAISLTRRSSMETARENFCDSQVNRSVSNAKLSFRHFKKSLQLLKPRMSATLNRTSTVVHTPSNYIFGSASVRSKSRNRQDANRDSLATLAWEDCASSIARSSMCPSEYQGMSVRATDSPTPSLWSRSSSISSSAPTCLVDRLDSRAHVPSYQRGLRKQAYPPRVRYSSLHTNGSATSFVPVLGQPF